MSNINLLPQLAANITIANNADWTDSLLITLPDNVSPVDITGLNFRVTIRSEVESVLTLLQLSTIDGTLINGGVTGVVSFNVPALMLLRIPAQTAAFDMVAQDGDGKVVNLFALSPGVLIINQGVTRDLDEVIVDYLSWLVPNLPTTPPDRAGALWLNNGVLCVSGLRSSLPVRVPAGAGKLWNNGGVLCVTSDGGMPTTSPNDTGYLWSNGGVVSIT